MRRTKRKSNSKNHINAVSVFLLLLGIIIIIDSVYSFLIFQSFVYVSLKYGMKITLFVVFTYAYLLFKLVVGVFSIYVSRKTA